MSNEITIKITTTVILTDEELEIAADVARLRNGSQRQSDRHDGKVMASSMAADLMGAEGELAVSKALGIPWDGKWLPVSIWDSWKIDGHDVGGLEVRTTNYQTGRLILQKRDKDYSPYLLVISSRPSFRLAGWVLGHEGKQDRYWATHVPRPCFMVPQNELKLIDTLRYLK